MTEGGVVHYLHYTQLLVSVGVICLILLWGSRRKKRFIESFRGSANDAFLKLRIEASSPTLTFCGTTAQVLNEVEEVEQSRGALLAYQLTRIARNSAGEYFYFVFRSDSKPYFKHLPQGTAKALLGSRYISKNIVG